MTADEPTRRVVILRSGIELTRMARTPGGAVFSETWRPGVGMVLELPELQAMRLVYNGAADILPSAPEKPPYTVTRFAVVADESAP